MSYKRSRSTYEEDQPAPYALFGTPLPDEHETRDDGSFVPVWKQEVRDERGRKRLHGAFTGGFSAGYFNTVGSKEGWAPSTFVSSRNNRHKDGAAPAQHRPEDYMDDEDLADAAEAQKLQTSQSFAGLGSSTQEELRAGGIMGLFRVQGDTMGLKLLRRMGWKDGQGIGPKVRRGARLEMRGNNSNDADKTYMFAPDDTAMIRFNRKTDRRGLGYDGEIQLSRLQVTNDEDDEDDAYDDNPSMSRDNFSISTAKPSKMRSDRGGMGVGILNDNGSDDEDPYEMGPKIKYNKVIGGDKKKKKKKPLAATNPSLRNAPVFVSKTARASGSLRRCHDGRLPLDGFVLAKVVEDLSALLSKYAPPLVPSGWKSAKSSAAEKDQSSSFVSTADAAKASTHDPKSRAALLGEKALPGKSVFDFLSSSARDKLAAASGRSDLPTGKGEVPEEFRQSEEEKQRVLWDQVGKLDRETALAALARSASGPYADDEAKKGRYRAYLESQANAAQPRPSKSSGMSDADFVKELNEFYNCARIFKPMTGFMASRFTTAKSSTSSLQNGSDTSSTAAGDLLSRPEPKPADPAEEAAKMGMFGHMTRSVADFYPTRLLCKRFNVKAPAHVRPDGDSESAAKPATDPWMGFERPVATTMAASTSAMEAAARQEEPRAAIEAPPAAEPAASIAASRREEAVVDPERNEAVEGKVAHEDVLHAIFGDSDSE